MPRFWAALAAMTAFATATQAAALDATPEWVKQPSSEDTQALWPPEALKRGIEGKVVLECLINVSGKAETCSAVSETPAGYGFGAAALQLAPSFVLKPAQSGGKPVPATIRVPIWFDAPLDTKPDWLRKPSGRELFAAFPKSAILDKVDGRIVLDCEVALSGTLEGCVVQEESPQGYGFGDAALLLVPSFLMKPGTRGGQPVRSPVRIPIRMDVGSIMRGASHLQANPSVKDKSMVLKPVWSSAPTFAELKAAWPKGLKAETAHASIRCELKADGTTEECGTLTEFPAAKGVGKAAERLGEKFRMRTAPGGSKELEGAFVNIPISFIDPASTAALAVTKPRWITQLDPEKLAAVYPAQAAAAGIRTGVGVAECIVAANGALTQCRPASAKPEGYGFAEAAVAVASVIQMNPWSDGGGPVDGARIKLPVTFNLADGEVPKP